MFNNSKNINSSKEKNIKTYTPLFNEWNNSII